jgi:Helix-turn-helix domain
MTKDWRFETFASATVCARRHLHRGWLVGFTVARARLSLLVWGVLVGYAQRRMKAGENVSVLARELGVSRKSIYQWRNRYRLGGGNALRSRRGRMTKAEVSTGAQHQFCIGCPVESRESIEMEISSER